MTLEECYESFGGNLEEVLGRLHNRSLVEKFLVKFLSDQSYEQLHCSLATNDVSEAFRAAHMLKGVCQNLGIGCLYESDRIVTDALRDGKNEVSPEMLRRLEEDYRLVVSSVREYQKSVEGEL